VPSDSADVTDAVDMMGDVEDVVKLETVVVVGSTCRSKTFLEINFRFRK